MNLSIRAQLIGGFGIAIALLIAVFGVAFWGMNSMASATDEIVLEDVPADVAVRELEKLVLEWEDWSDATRPRMPSARTATEASARRTT